MKITMTLKKKQEFAEFDRWTKLIASGCEHLREPEYVGIPALLPKCALTDKPCRFDNCPKRVVNQNTEKKP